MLCAEFLPEPRGDWGTGQAGNVEVFLFPSLVLRPRMERDTGLLGGILLEITAGIPALPLRLLLSTTYIFYFRKRKSMLINRLGRFPHLQQLRNHVIH
jgi:hypothetical protein